MCTHETDSRTLAIVLFFCRNEIEKKNTFWNLMISDRIKLWPLHTKQSFHRLLLAYNASLYYLVNATNNKTQSALILLLIKKCSMCEKKWDNWPKEVETHKQYIVASVTYISGLWNTIKRAIQKKRNVSRITIGKTATYTLCIYHSDTVSGATRLFIAQFGGFALLIVFYS